MVGWHHRFDGHDSEQSLGVGDEQGSLVCYSAWGRQESDTTDHAKLGNGQNKQNIFVLHHHWKDIITMINK